MKSQVWLSWCALSLVPVACLAQSANESSAVADLTEVRELPDPFALADGGRVATPEDWARRREEIARLLQEHQYGHLPPRPDELDVAAEVDEESGAEVQQLEVRMRHGERTAEMPVTLYLPAGDAKGLPVVVRGSFGRWAGRGDPAARVAPLVERGYAVAEFSKFGVAADTRDAPRSGLIYDLYGDDIDCGALMAWAWGMHRVIDALETVDEVDAGKVVVTGHSRYGKAALLAGAFDERVAVTVPSHSGCAGTAPYRFIYGESEQLHNIVNYAPHWFHPDFKRFIGNVNRLPFDQHTLRALVAPRAQMSTEGTQDAWTNPEGSQLTYLAAKEVYDFLGAPDRLSIRFREVGHVPSREDLLDFADHVLFDKPLPAPFGQLPYDVDTAAYTWSAPSGQNPADR